MKRLFDAVYLLTLSSSADRQQHFGKSFAQLPGVPVTKLLGFDTRALAITHDWRCDITFEKSGGGTLGCYLSHYQAIQFAHLTGQRVLVLEDDVVLCENFMDRLANELVDVPDDWPIFTLSGSTPEGVMRSGTHAYIVDGQKAWPFLVNMSRTRIGGSVLCFRENSKQFGLRHSIDSLAKQNTRLPNGTCAIAEREFQSLTGKEIRAATFAQYGEDTLVSEYFNEARGKNPDWRPRFLEIGAMNGRRDSNCYKLFLEGWKGVCIEPNPFHFVHLQQTYAGTRVETVCALIGPDHGLRTLHLNRDGLTTSHPEVFAKVKEKAFFATHCSSPVATPDELAERFGTDFDFVSIDSEGMDLDILRASGKLLEGTKLICIETDLPSEDPNPDHRKLVYDTLASMGFPVIVHQTQGNTLAARE